jgi:hypothetical protein
MAACNTQHRKPYCSSSTILAFSCAIFLPDAEEAASFSCLSAKFSLRILSTSAVSWPNRSSDNNAALDAAAAAADVDSLLDFSSLLISCRTDRCYENCAVELCRTIACNLADYHFKLLDPLLLPLLLFRGLPSPAHTAVHWRTHPRWLIALASVRR